MEKVGTVTISKAEYDRLKALEKIDSDLLDEIAKGLEDIRAGRVKEWK